MIFDPLRHLGLRSSLIIGIVQLLRRSRSGTGATFGRLISVTSASVGVVAILFFVDADPLGISRSSSSTCRDLGLVAYGGRQTRPHGRVAQDTHDVLAGVSTGRAEISEGPSELREAQLEATGLDARTFALVEIAALITLDAPRRRYASQIATRSSRGSRTEDILGCCGPSRPRSAGRRDRGGAESHARARPLAPGRRVEVKMPPMRRTPLLARRRSAAACSRASAGSSSRRRTTTSRLGSTAQAARADA